MFCIIAGLDPVRECEGDEDGGAATSVSADTSRSYPLVLLLAVVHERRSSAVPAVRTLVAAGFDSRSFHGNICCDWCDLLLLLECVEDGEVEDDVVDELEIDADEVDETAAAVEDALPPPFDGAFPSFVASFNGNFCFTCTFDEATCNQKVDDAKFRE